MMIPVLVAAVLQLLLFTGFYWVIRRRDKGNGPRVSVFVWLIVLGIVAQFFFSAVALSLVLVVQLIVTGLLAIAWSLRGRSTGDFVRWSGLVTVLMFIAVGSRGVWQASRARAENPFESIADRLAYESPWTVADGGSSDPRLTETGRTRLKRTEQLVEQHMHRVISPYGRRTEVLQRVHSSHVRQFIESDGFGVFRMRATMDAVRLPEPIPIPQPDAGTRGDDEEGSTDQRAPRWTVLAMTDEIDKDRAWLHNSSVRQFTNPAGYGLFRDREHVAGFRPHRFKELPHRVTRKSEKAWSLARVELVSLLKHERPGVYESDNLPRMDELRSSSLRPLDEFEQSALGRLEQGEDLVASSDGSLIRMLGSLRAVKQCRQCHSVKRGTLLGAFSYRLNKAGGKQSSKRPPRSGRPAT